MKFAVQVLASLLIAVAPVASAQSKSAAKPPAPKPPAAKPSAAKPAPTKPAAATLSRPLASLQFAAAGLPEGVTLADGIHCISVQAQNFWEAPDALAPILPAPLGKAGQSFRKGKATLGSIVAFEYDETLPDDSCDFLRAMMWGEDAPTKQHPELLLFVGRFFVILSFPEGEPATAWFKAQLEERLKPYAPHDWSGLQTMIDQVGAAMDGRDPDTALALLQKHADEIADYALAQYALGEATAAKKQWPAAEAAYARALELHDAGTDRLPGGTLLPWSAVDGLSMALMYQELNDRAVPVLERGVALARTLGDDKRTGRSLYNFACGLARVGRFEDCLGALTECIAKTPEHKEMAAKDSDFAKAIKRPDFRKLLGI